MKPDPYLERDGNEMSACILTAESEHIALTRSQWLKPGSFDLGPKAEALG